MRTIRMLAAVVVVAGAAMVVPLAAPAAAGGGCHETLDGTPTQASGATVEVTGACMTPTVLRVEAGTDVTFANRGGVGHNLFGAGLAVSAFNGGDTVSRRYDAPGTYPYACTLHPGMVGAVVVGDGRFGVDIPAPRPVEPATTTSAAPVPLAATRSPQTTETGDSTALIVLVAVALTVVVGSVGYGFGRRSTELGTHDRADG